MTTKTLKQNDYFQSSEIALCAALCFHGYHIDSVDKKNPSKAIFLIKRDKQLDDLIQKYWTHQLQVEPMSYFNFLKELKARIYS